MWISYFANGFVNLMLYVRDMIFQRGNNAHNLLALLLQPASFPLGHLK